MGVLKMKVPYGIQLKICHRRMFATTTEIANEFGMAEGTIFAILKRNQDVLDELQAVLRRKTINNEPIYDGNASVNVGESRGYTTAQLSMFRDLLNDGVHYVEAGATVGMPDSTAHGYSRAWPEHRRDSSKKSDNQYGEKLDRFFDLLDNGISKESAAKAVGMKHSTAQTYYRSWEIKNGKFEVASDE